MREVTKCELLAKERLDLGGWEPKRNVTKGYWGSCCGRLSRYNYICKTVCLVSKHLASVSFQLMTKGKEAKYTLCAAGLFCQ